MTGAIPGSYEDCGSYEDRAGGQALSASPVKSMREAEYGQNKNFEKAEFRFPCCLLRVSFEKGKKHEKKQKKRSMQSHRAF